MLYQKVMTLWKGRQNLLKYKNIKKNKNKNKMLYEDFLEKIKDQFNEFFLELNKQKLKSISLFYKV